MDTPKQTNQPQFNQSQPKAKKKPSLITIIIVVAALLIGVAAGYFLWRPKENENENTNQSVFNANINNNININGNINANSNVNANANLNANANVNANINANTNANANANGNINTNSAVNSNTNTTVNQTAGWATYNNSTYKYQIKYPNTWFVKTCSDAYAAFASTESRLPPCFTEASSDIQISVNDSMLYTNYLDEITQTKAALNVTSEEDITIAGLTAKRIAGTAKALEGPGPAEGTQEIYVALFNNDKIYRIVYYKNTTSDYSAIFDLMVSTFQFTN